MGYNNVTDAFRGWLKTYTGEHQPYTVVSGEPADSALVPFTFRAVIQNATPRDLLVLPEGNREVEAIKIHTVTLLSTGSTGTDSGDNGDLITYDGFKWLVYNIADRKIGKYNKAIAIKKPRLTV